MDKVGASWVLSIHVFILWFFIICVQHRIWTCFIIIKDSCVCTHTHTHTHMHVQTGTSHKCTQSMQASSHTHILSLQCGRPDCIQVFSYRKYAALWYIFQSFSIAAHCVFIKCVSVGNQMCWCECMCLSVSLFCCASRAQSFSFQLSSAYRKLKNNLSYSQTCSISVLESWLAVLMCFVLEYFFLYYMSCHFHFVIFF